MHENRKIRKTLKAPRETARELADPYQRGKLTPHGWRVAYHLARSIKKRKLGLPETLPQCLYPPGHAPVVTPAAEGKDDAAGVTEALKTPNNKAAGGESKKSRKISVGGAAAVKGGKVAAGTGKGTGKRKGKLKRGGETQEKEEVGDATASGIGDSKIPNKNKEKNGGRKEQAAGKNKKRRSVGGKAASSMSNASSEETDDKAEGAEFRMSNAQQARYNKMFDKVTKRKSVQAIDSAEVGASLFTLCTNFFDW